MSVIAFPNLAPQGPEASMSWELRSLTAINRSPLNAVVTTLERPGAHWAVRMPYQNLAADRRARLQSFVSSARGHAQRFYVPVYGWTRRGSFPATELFTNTAFDGTTGWSPTNATLTANDGQLRITATTPAANVSVQQSVSLTQYAPHALRSLLIDGVQTSGLSIGRFLGDGTVAINDYSTSRGVGTVVLVPVSVASSAQFPAFVNSTSGFLAGAYLTLGYTSLARCALADNGPNLLLRSDEFDNATWTKSDCTVDANTVTAPDGSATGDILTEDTDSAAHFVSQSATVSSAGADYSFCVALRQNVRTWAAIALVEGTGATSAVAYVNLGTGALGTVTAGANWANARAYVAALGNNWFRVCLVARKTNSATSISAQVYSATADSTAVYLGNGSQAIAMWRATLAQSSVSTRLVQTTATASSGTSQTGGALHLKGLPASTNGLLLQGDPAEIITGSTSQLVRTRSPLNSDAAGLGYFEFEPPLRISPSDNAAVIVHNPMCRMMMENNVNGWTDRIGGFADLEFAAVEDVSP